MYSFENNFDITCYGDKIQSITKLKHNKQKKMGTRVDIVLLYSRLQVDPLHNKWQYI